MSFATAVCSARMAEAQFSGSPANPFSTTAPPPTFSTTPVPTLPTTPSAGTYPPAAPYSLAPTWDPYAAPGTTPAPATPSPYGQPAPQNSLGFPFSDWSDAANTTMRLVQNVSVRETWMAGTGFNDLGMNDVDLSATLAFPFFWSINTAPILVTPGFNFHLLNGPDADPPRDIPGALYDTFVQTSWRPQATERLSADLAISLGIYTDYSFVNSSSLRILGRGIGLYQFTPQWQGALGVVYLDRLDTKILPAGGLIWRPHDDARFEILFPQPKLAQRITNYGNAEIWGYVAGEYGGGQWSISHVVGPRDVINYNDLRILLGVEAYGFRNYRALFEVGYVFNREIIYQTGVPEVHPDDTVLLRAGLGF